MEVVIRNPGVLKVLSRLPEVEIRKVLFTMKRKELCEICDALLISSSGTKKELIGSIACRIVNKRTYEGIKNYGKGELKLYQTNSVTVTGEEILKYLAESISNGKAVKNSRITPKSIAFMLVELFSYEDIKEIKEILEKSLT